MEEIPQCDIHCKLYQQRQHYHPGSDQAFVVANDPFKWLLAKRLILKKGPVEFAHQGSVNNKATLSSSSNTLSKYPTEQDDQ